jgi:RNA-directed DNA polymerase
VFAAETGERTAKGQSVWQRLAQASATKIRRHTKIRKDANPFDPAWQPYFLERAFRKKFGISRHQAGIQPS